MTGNHTLPICVLLLVAQLAAPVVAALEIVSGTITDATSGSPLPGVDLDVFDMSGASIPLGGLASDGSGNFAVVLPGPGEYVVRADPGTGDAYAAQYFDGVHLRSFASALIVSPNEFISGIDFALPAGSRISGRITQSGVPVAGVDIDVFDVTGEFLGAYPGTSDVLGNYVVGALPPGSYFVKADPAKSTGLVGEFAGGGHELFDAVPVVLLATDLTGVDIDLDLGGSIAGIVRRASDAIPLAGIDIDVFDALGNRMSVNATSDPLGAYDVGILAPGNYFVRADPTLAQGYANRFFADAIDLAFADAIAVAAGGTTSATDLAVEPSASISGAIVDGAGAGLEGIDLDLFEATTDARLLPSATTGPTGSYSFPSLNAGSYKVRADPTLVQAFERRYHITAEVLAQANPVALATGGTVAGVDVALAAGGAVSGVVTDGQTGAPVANATIRIYGSPSGLKMDQQTTTALDGTYLVWGLPVGSYLVLADPLAGTSTRGPTWFGDTGFTASAVPVPLVGGSVTPDVSIRLPEPSGLLPGVVGLALLQFHRRERRRAVRSGSAAGVASK